MYACCRARIKVLNLTFRQIIPNLFQTIVIKLNPEFTGSRLKHKSLPSSGMTRYSPTMTLICRQTEKCMATVLCSAVSTT